MVTPSGYPGTQGGVATLGSAVATWRGGHVTTRGTMVRGGQIIDHEDPDTRHQYTARGAALNRNKLSGKISVNFTTLICNVISTSV